MIVELMNAVLAVGALILMIGGLVCMPWRWEEVTVWRLAIGIGAAPLGAYWSGVWLGRTMATNPPLISVPLFAGIVAVVIMLRERLGRMRKVRVLKNSYARTEVLPEPRKEQACEEPMSEEERQRAEWEAAYERIKQDERERLEDESMPEEERREWKNFYAQRRREIREEIRKYL